MTGTGIAIEYAVVLAELLDERRSLDDALRDAFMARRYDRCRLVVENCLQLGEREKRALSVSPVWGFLHSASEMYVPSSRGVIRTGTPHPSRARFAMPDGAGNLLADRRLVTFD